MNRVEFLDLIGNDQAIIFDYGGIFIDIDYDLTITALNKLTTKDASRLYTKAKQVSIFNELETGKISQREFLDFLKYELDIKTSDDEVIKAWNSMLIDIKVERFEFLKELALKKRVFLLSNINQIHEDFLKDYIAKRRDLSGFYDTFENIYFSHQVGMRKPNKEIFEMVISENNLDPSKTLFLDDSIQHVEGAKLAGLKSVLLDPPNSFIVQKNH
jgi:FMN phosphatase YigB (HAD superfamily)